MSRIARTSAAALVTAAALVSTVAIVTPAAASAATETRREMACKDAASEGDLQGMRAAFQRCERLYGDHSRKALIGGKRVVPCHYEEGRGDAANPQRHPCYWDAQVQGNGEGVSFVVARVGGRLFFLYETKRLNRLYGGFQR